MTPTEQKWFERVRAWRESGLCAREFSTVRGFTAGGLRHWACRLRRRGLTAETVPRVRLARVAGVPAVEARALTVEVDGARLTVPPGFDEATLRAVVSAVRDGGAR